MRERIYTEEFICDGCGKRETRVWRDHGVGASTIPALARPEGWRERKSDLGVQHTCSGVCEVKVVTTAHETERAARDVSA